MTAPLPTLPATGSTNWTEWAAAVHNNINAIPGDISTALGQLVGSAPDALNTLAEIDAQIATDESSAAAMAALLATKVDSAAVNAAVSAQASIDAAKYATVAQRRALAREIITRRTIRVATAAPTITVGAANAATAISGSTLRAPLAGSGTGATQVVNTAADPYFRYYGSPSVLYNSGLIRGTLLTGTTSSIRHDLRVASIVYCDQLEIEFNTPNTFFSYRLRVNDEWVTKKAVKLISLTASATYRILVNFGSVAMRKIQIDMPDGGFAGVRMIPAHSIRRIEQVVGTPTIFVGDSVTKYANRSTDAGYTSVDSWANYFAEILGWRDVRNTGLPSTGFVTNGTEINLQNRLADFAVSGARIVCYAGLNDVSVVATTLPAAIDTVFSAIVAAGPAEFIVIGCHPSVNSFYTNSNYQQVNTLLQSKAAQYGALFIDPFSVKWVDANNGSLFVNADNIHPTGDGAEWLGTAYADEYARLVLSS
jgi:lysophospholipase L1-like esterase